MVAQARRPSRSCTKVTIGGSRYSGLAVEMTMRST